MGKCTISAIKIIPTVMFCYLCVMDPYLSQQHAGADRIKNF